MTAFLITGNPGSGKTTLAAELSRQGFSAMDADDIAGWQTGEGVAITPPPRPSDEWLLSHRWAWSRRRLQEAITELARDGQPVFVCGIAMNQREMLDLFELVFLLSRDEATQLQRLYERSKGGRDQAQRRQIIEGRTIFEQEMRSLGAIVLDGRLPPGVLAARILQEIRCRPRRG